VATETKLTWSDIQPGDTITVKRVYGRGFKFVVRKVDNEDNPTVSYRFVFGKRLRMDGTPSTRRTQMGRRFGERLEWLHIDDVIDHTRPTPKPENGA
jgi:hypothetical protein